MRRIVVPAAAAAFILALAFGGPASALDEPAPGMLDLGIDISQAGGTPEAVQQFLAQLLPDGQRSILTACERILSEQAGNYEATTYSFCQNAV